MNAINDLKAAFEHLAEIEFMERYYGLAQRCDDNYEIAAAETRGLDDPIEYQGYRWDSFSDFNDYETPWAAYVPTIEWSDIPF